MMAVMSTVAVSAEMTAPKAEPQAYAGSAITISAAVVRFGCVVRLWSVIRSPRSVVAIASVVAVVTIAMVVMAPMSTEVGRLACADGCGIRVVSICCGATEQRRSTDGNGNGERSHLLTPWKTVER